LRRPRVACDGRPVGRLLVPSAIIAALLAFAPWAHVSLAILGVNSPSLSAKGTEIGSGLGFGLGAGWIAVLLAVVVVVRYASGHAPIASAIVLLLFVLYTVATLSHHSVSISGPDGQILSGLGAHVTIAWGSVAELVAAVVVVAAACANTSTAPSIDDEANEYAIKS
jgi:hypothetical protein